MTVASAESSSSIATVLVGGPTLGTGQWCVVPERGSETGRCHAARCIPNTAFCHMEAEPSASVAFHDLN